MHILVTIVIYVSIITGDAGEVCGEEVTMSFLPQFTGSISDFKGNQDLDKQQPSNLKVM